MSEQSENIKKTFENVVSIYEQTSRFLLDADGLLQKSGFECTHATTLGTNQSKAIQWPGWWLARYAGRHYARLESADIKKGIYVIYFDGNGPIQPVVVSGQLNMKKNKDGEPVYLGYEVLPNAWFYNIDEKKLNTNISINMKDNGKAPYTSGILRAISLEDVKDQDTLSKLVVAPLLEMTI